MIKNDVTSKLSTAVQDAISEKLFPGAVLGFINGDESDIKAFGHHTYKPDSTAVDENTLYDLASITKVIPLASVLLQLIQEGKLDLQTRVIDVLPEFDSHEDKRDVRIVHLLTYTLKFQIGAMSLMVDKSAEDIRKTVLTAPLRTIPGESHFYTNTSAFIMGCVIKAVTGNDLSVEAERRFFEPLGMNDTFFEVPSDYVSRCAPSEITATRGLIQGVVHDESTLAVNKIFQPGVAGLFSTVGNLQKYLQMILTDGEHYGKIFFNPETIKQIWTFSLPTVRQNLSLGWQHESDQFYFGGQDESFIFTTGFTGASIMVDTVSKKALVLLNNHTYPQRRPNRDDINAFRTKVANIFF
jgi:CubicO group peptidase (beta-lactamase class C family)